MFTPRTLKKPTVRRACRITGNTDQADRPAVPRRHADDVAGTQRRNGVTLLIHERRDHQRPDLASATGSPVVSSTTRQKNRSDHRCSPSDRPAPAPRPARLRSCRTGRTPARPTMRSSFSRLAGDSGSAATMILLTELAARSMPLRLRQIGEMQPVAAHAGPDGRLELADQLELHQRRRVVAGARTRSCRCRGLRRRAHRDARPDGCRAGTRHARKSSGVAPTTVEGRAGTSACA